MSRVLNSNHFIVRHLLVQTAPKQPIPKRLICQGHADSPTFWTWTLDNAVRTEYFSRYSVHDIIMADRDQAFCSKLVKSVEKHR